MTIDEAIKHCIEVAEDRAGCAEDCVSEHRQLAKWLIELKAVREAWSQLVDTAIEIKDNAVDNKDSDTNARDTATFFFNYLKVLEDRIIKEVDTNETSN